MPAESEVQARILSRLVTHTPFPLLILHQVTGRELDASADGVAVRFRADKENFQPMIGVSAVVAQQLRPLAIVTNQNVDVAVIIEIAGRCAAAYAGRLHAGTEPQAHVFKPAPPDIAEHQLGLTIACIGAIALDVIQYVSIGHKEITRTVVVVIKEAGSKTAQIVCVVADAGEQGIVVEALVSKVPVKAAKLQVEMRDKQILPIGAGDVRGIHSHSGLRLTVAADRDSQSVSNFAKRAVALVAKEVVWHAVVGDKDVLPAIVVVVEGNHTQSVARLFAYA